MQRGITEKPISSAASEGLLQAVVSNKYRKMTGITIAPFIHQHFQSRSEIFPKLKPIPLPRNKHFAGLSVKWSLHHSPQPPRPSHPGWETFLLLSCLRDTAGNNVHVERVRDRKWGSPETSQDIRGDCSKLWQWLIKSNEIRPFAARWMNLEIVTLREESQTEKEKYRTTSLICGI